MNLSSKQCPTRSERSGGGLILTRELDERPGKDHQPCTLLPAALKSEVYKCGQALPLLRGIKRASPNSILRRKERLIWLLKLKGLRNRNFWWIALKGDVMLRYAAVFFVEELAAAICGVLGNAAAAVNVARLLFYVFLILFLVSLVGGMARRS